MSNSDRRCYHWIAHSKAETAWNVVTIIHMGASVRSESVQWWKTSKNTFCYFTNKKQKFLNVKRFAIGITFKFDQSHINTGHHISDFPERRWNISAPVYSIEFTLTDSLLLLDSPAISQIKLDREGLITHTHTHTNYPVFTHRHYPAQLQPGSPQLCIQYHPKGEDAAKQIYSVMVTVTHAFMYIFSKHCV